MRLERVVTETSAERRAALVAALLAAPFVLLTVLVATRVEPLMRVDASITRELHNAVGGTGWQHVFDLVSTLGQPRFAEVALAVVAVGFAVRRQWWTTWWIVTSLVVTALGWSLMKEWIKRPRPAIPDQTSGWSYPSGHSGEIACAAALLLILTWRQLRPGWLRVGVASAWVAAGVLVGLSRLFVGAHYPSDVVGGWLEGVLVVYVLGALFGIVNPRAHGADERPLSSMPENLRTLAVIVNPIKIDSDPFRIKVSQAARAAGWDDPLWFETTVDDAGASMARAAVAAGADVVVAAGGDGTVRVVCAEMASTGVPVGVVPAGTGNLLARNLGIPLGRDQALEVVLRGQDRAIDLVMVKGDGLEATRFAVMAGMGLDAAIMAGAPDALKRRMGWPAYVVAGMRHLRYPAVRVTISVDGSEPVHRRARTVLVGNVGSLTAGIPLLPDARIDDGVLDVVVIAPLRVLGWFSLLWRVLTRHPRTDERLDRFTGRSVVVTAASATPRQLDGDPVGSGTEIHAEVEPGVLLVRVPR
jgi:diacylglycerol kinase family enzyme/membrane-associated phospholipid phosphatase